jgi:hypothetical protein
MRDELLNQTQFLNLGHESSITTLGMQGYNTMQPDPAFPARTQEASHEWHSLNQ